MNIRLNVAVRDLVENHRMTHGAAVSLAAALETEPRWFLRFGLVIERTNRQQMPVADVRAWMIKHGYMTAAQKECA